MSVLKHLKTLQHVSIFSDHLQGAYRFLVKVTEFKVFKMVKVICGDVAVCVVCVRGARCGEVCWTAVYIIILTF